MHLVKFNDEYIWLEGIAVHFIFSLTFFFKSKYVYLASPP